MGTCVDNNLNLNPSNVEGVREDDATPTLHGDVSNSVPPEIIKIGPSLGGQAHIVSKSGDNLNIPPVSGSGAHLSSSVGLDSHSIRSLRKQLKSKSKMSKEQTTSISLSVSIHKYADGGNVSDDEVGKEAHKSLSIREVSKSVNSSSEENDDAASHTSNNARSNSHAFGDSSNVAKGISSHPSGIVFTNQEISFVKVSILAHANSFKDELVVGETEES